MKLLVNLFVALLCVCLFQEAASAAALDSTEAVHLLRTVQQHYQSQRHLECRQVVNYYTDHRTSEARESQELILKRSGNKVYKRFMGLEELMDERYYLSVYSTRQILTIDLPVRHPASELVFSSLNLEPENINRLTCREVKGLTVITIRPADPEIERMEYTIDRQLKQMVKQVVYYATPFQNYLYNLDDHPRIEIVTQSLNTHSNPALTEFFAGEGFLLNQVDNTSLADRFRHYTINNLLTAQNQ